MYDKMMFLHCMSKLSYLTGTLESGFMFTDHQVIFDPFFGLPEEERRKHWAEIVPFAQSLFKARLKLFGVDFDKLDEQRKHALFHGVGTIRGNVPMLCFSEVPKNVLIRGHASRFGHYGVVMSKEWIEINQGERVVYVGQGSPLSKKMMQSVTAIMAQSISVDKNGTPLFENWAIYNVLELFTFFEVRVNENEREWRIGGRTGFMGGERDTGRRISFDMSKCKYIFVKESDEIEQIETFVHSVHGAKEGAPQVMTFPEKMPG